MSESIHVLAQQIFGKASADECDLQEIKNLTQRFPYFAPAQFLLLEKLKKENSEEYQNQLQKAVLYYHDPLQFEYFISSDRFYTEINFEEEQIEKSEISFDEIEKENQKPLETEPPKVEEPASVEEIIVSSIQNNSQSEIVNWKSEIQNQKPETDLVFEPYHTVDYFASQGIKFSQEDVPKDRFGKQLKSFTGWLKTMKRLPVKEIQNSIDPLLEKNVQHLAEDSVHESDVITEAMAEVWIKQGNIQKALEVYNKLALLNPSKSAYFAGLIENLKRS